MNGLALYYAITGYVDLIKKAKANKKPQRK